MKALNVVLSCTLVFCFSNCASIKIPPNFNSLISPSNIHEIEGKYQIEGEYQNISVSYKIPLWDLFYSTNMISAQKSVVDSNSYFSLTLLPKEKIQIEFLVQGDLMFKNLYKYKFVKGGIEISGKSNYSYQGVPLIFYRCSSTALWFSKDSEDDLYLSYNGSSSGGLFVFIFRHPYQGKVRFEKVKHQE